MQGILDFSVKEVLIAGRPFKGIGPIFGRSQRSQQDEYGCGLSYEPSAYDVAVVNCTRRATERMASTLHSQTSRQR